MAKERPITPEKQLLKLIEEPKTGATSVPTQTIKHHSLSLFSFSAWLGRISFFREKFKKWFQGTKPQQLNIKFINKISAIFIFVLAVYFISNLFSSLINLKKMPDLEIKPREDTGLAVIEEQPFLKKAASYYLEKIRTRDIFRMAEKKIPETVIERVTSRIIEATQHLRLVGISWSNDPDAMIEDTKALRTFFVKKGQMIGEVKVEAIFKDKVVLSYDGEEIELR